MQTRASFSIGETATITRQFTQADIDAFAQLSGDTNPVHLDEAYARTTYFGGRIAHGMLVVSLISSLLGNTLPGPGCIYLGQDLKFLAPVRPGDTVTARVEVTAWDEEKGRIRLLTEVRNQDGVVVITGEARLVMASYLKIS